MKTYQTDPDIYENDKNLMKFIGVLIVFFSALLFGAALLIWMVFN